MSVLTKPFCAIRREWAVFVETVRSPAFRELLLWCLPALVLGAIARAALNLHFPYGYFQGDTPDFLVTASRFVKSHALVIHGKKAFLAPILFTFPFLLHIPALIIIPIVQHLAGLAATIAAGGIVRCWFRLWRWFIVHTSIRSFQFTLVGRSRGNILALECQRRRTLHWGFSTPPKTS